jgi:hypothetical protein
VGEYARGTSACNVRRHGDPAPHPRRDPGCHAGRAARCGLARAGTDWSQARRPVQLRLAPSALWLSGSTQRAPHFAGVQHLEVGDRIEWGPEYLTVPGVEPNRALVLSYTGHGMEWVWQFGRYPLDAQHTRLVSRGSERTPNTASSWLMMRVIEPASFVMTTRMLLNVKKRAERLYASGTPRCTRVA